jgi:DNA polymerase I-like protein with 3'-5' exonuclease and polymerase domains
MIQVLDPKTVYREPVNRTWICCGLDKARRIDTGESTEELVDLNITPTLEQVRAFTPGEAMLAIDIECIMQTGELTCIGFAYRAGEKVETLTIPLMVGRYDYWSENDELVVWDKIAELLGSANPKLFQNFIFDTMMLSRLGIQTNGRIYDTMTLQHLISPELKKGLTELGRLYLMCDVWKDIKSWESNETLWKYNARDTFRTLLIHEKQQEALNENKRNLYENQLVPLSTEVLRMCERGWDVDFEVIKEMQTSYEAKASALFHDLRDFATDLIRPKITFKFCKQKIKDGATYCRGVGRPTKQKFKKNSKGEEVLDDVAFSSYQEVLLPEEIKSLKEVPYPVFEKVTTEVEFNPKSPDQVKDVLRGLGIKVPIRKGKECTDDLALKRLADKYPEYPFFNNILEYRKTTKIVDTYCSVKVDPDKKLRFSITIPGTKGSRFSSNKTPWGTGLQAQNLPRNFRQIVTCGKDELLLSADFKQADPHMVAWLSGCESMLKQLKEGDLHCYTASFLYNKDVTKAMKKERQDGKMCNNAFNYGMQTKTYMNNARKKGRVMTWDEAQHHYETYHNIYPEVKKVWWAEVKEQILRTRTLTTPFGRDRYFYDHMSDEYSLAKMMNQALSYVPQTHVSDALNKGNLIFLDAIGRLGIECHWIQQGHDGNVWVVKEKDLEDIIPILQDSYKSVIFNIKGRECCFPIDIEYGKNWMEMTEWTC